MPRTKRLDLPDVTQHVVQRGNDRQACFYREADYLRYLLREAALKQGCAIHAYVVMTNDVHLLVAPAAVGPAGRMMQSVGRRYVRYLNAAIARTRTLWQGRYKASLVQDERGRTFRLYGVGQGSRPLRAVGVAYPASVLGLPIGADG